MVCLIYFKNNIEFLDASELTGPYDLVIVVRDSFACSVLQPCVPYKT